MQSYSPFVPKAAGTVNIDVSASSQRVDLDTFVGEQQVRVMNDGTATVWINFGDSTVTAALATSMPVGPGVTEVITVRGGSAINVAAIAAGSTGKIYFTPGAGV